MQFLFLCGLLSSVVSATTYGTITTDIEPTEPRRSPRLAPLKRYNDNLFASQRFRSQPATSAASNDVQIRTTSDLSRSSPRSRSIKEDDARRAIPSARRIATPAQSAGSGRSPPPRKNVPSAIKRSVTVDLGSQGRNRGGPVSQRATPQRAAAPGTGAVRTPAATQELARSDTLAAGSFARFRRSRSARMERPVVDFLSTIQETVDPSEAIAHVENFGSKSQRDALRARGLLKEAARYSYQTSRSATTPNDPEKFQSDIDALAAQSYRNRVGYSAPMNPGALDAEILAIKRALEFERH